MRWIFHETCSMTVSIAWLLLWRILHWGSLREKFISLAYAVHRLIQPLLCKINSLNYHHFTFSILLWLEWIIYIFRDCVSVLNFPQIPLRSVSFSLSLFPLYLHALQSLSASLFLKLPLTLPPWLSSILSSL